MHEGPSQWVEMRKNFLAWSDKYTWKGIERILYNNLAKPKEQNKREGEQSGDQAVHAAYTCAALELIIQQRL